MSNSIVIALSVTILMASEVIAQGRVELEMPALTLEEARQGNGRVFGARFSPDGSELWIGRNQQLFIFDTDDGRLTNQIATSPFGPQRGGFISNLWFVAEGKYLLLEAHGAGGQQIPRFGLLRVDHRSRQAQWFDPSGQGTRGVFAGELADGELAFVCGAYERGSRLQHWTVVDPTAAARKALPVDCNIAIELVEFMGRDNERRHFLPQDVCSGEGVNLVAVQCGSQNPSIRSTSLMPVELTRDGNALAPVYGEPWSFSSLPLAIHWHGEYAASQRQLNPSSILVHAHTRDGRLARVGELRIGLASRSNLGWHGDFLAAADFPDPSTRRRSVETSVRIATFKAIRPPHRLLTGKGVSASVATVSIEGKHVLTDRNFDTDRKLTDRNFDFKPVYQGACSSQGFKGCVC